MPWKKRTNGGWIADYLTEGEAAQFWRENKNIGAGITARMMKAGGGKVTLYGSTKEQRAPEQQAQKGAGDPADLPPADPPAEEPGLARAKFWRPGFG